MRTGLRNNPPALRRPADVRLGTAHGHLARSNAEGSRDALQANRPVLLGPDLTGGDAVAVGGEVSRARFSPREPSRCVAGVDHRHIGDRVARSGKHLFAPQNGAGERPQLTGIGRRLPRHVFHRAASV